MKWEYRTVYIDFAQSHCNRPDSSLTELGFKEWEAIGTYKEGVSFFVLMKRPMSKDTHEQIKHGNWRGFLKDD